MAIYLGNQGQTGEAFPLLPIQAWFLKKDLKNRNHFNHSFLIQADQRINARRLRGALEGLSRRHEMLRGVFGGATQSCRKEAPIPEVMEWDIRGKSDQETHEALTGWQNRFDIEQGYLWQAGIVRGYEDGSERIFLAVHHLVFDAASWPIVREDLKKLYEGEEPGAEGNSYRQWVEAVAEYGGKASPSERRFWEAARDRFAAQQTLWDGLAEQESGELRFTRIELSEEVMQRLFRAGGGKVGDLLLSGLGCALREVTGQRRNWVTIEQHGREKIDPRIDPSRTVGWFTTMFPACLTAGNDVGETVAEIGKMLGEIPNNGIGYGTIHGYDLLPKVLFNYLERLGGTTENSWPIRFGEPSGEGMCPENRYGNAVDINGLTAGGKIRLGVESCLKEKVHDLLCEAFRKNIEAVAYAQG